MTLPVTHPDLVSAASGELSPLVPHPIEIALAGYVLLVLVLLVVAVVLASTGRVRMGWVGWVGFAVLLLGPFPFIGPIGAGVLLVLHATTRTSDHRTPAPSSEA